MAQKWLLYGLWIRFHTIHYIRKTFVLLSWGRLLRFICGTHTPPFEWHFSLIGYKRQTHETKDCKVSRTFNYELKSTKFYWFWFLVFMLYWFNSKTNQPMTKPKLLEARKYTKYTQYRKRFLISGGNTHEIWEKLHFALSLHKTCVTKFSHGKGLRRHKSLPRQWISNWTTDLCFIKVAE